MRDAEPRSLRAREVPLHNRGNPASTTGPKTAEHAEPRPWKGRAPHDAKHHSPEMSTGTPSLALGSPCLADPFTLALNLGQSFHSSGIGT